MRVRIVNEDGKVLSTKVLTESGADISNLALGINVSLPTESVPVATIKFALPAVDLVCESKFVDESRLNISIPVRELHNLVSALRKDAQLQPQLGRLAWMTIGSFEAAIADHDERVKHVINGGADAARESEVVQR